MSEEQTEAVAEAEIKQESVQEEQQVTEVKEEKRQVPLDALEAERKKRQDAEYQAKWYQQQMATLQQQQPQKQDDEDEYTKQIKAEIRRDISLENQTKVEGQYLAEHPEVAEAIQTKLGPILQKKPHLSYAIQNADNRYAEAIDIIEKYSPKVASDSVKKKIEQNQTMPGSPASTGKSGGVSKSEMLNRMRKNKREFSQYRAQLRGTTPNIR